MPAEPTDKAYLDVRELSARTGRSITSLRRDVKSGRIQAFQPAGPGGKLLFRPDAIENRTRGTQDLPQPATLGPAQLSGRRPKWMMVQVDAVDQPPPEQ